MATPTVSGRRRLHSTVSDKEATSWGRRTSSALPPRAPPVGKAASSGPRCPFHSTVTTRLPRGPPTGAGHSTVPLAMIPLRPPPPTAEPPFATPPSATRKRWSGTGQCFRLASPFRRTVTTRPLPGSGEHSTSATASRRRPHSFVPPGRKARQPPDSSSGRAVRTAITDSQKSGEPPHAGRSTAHQPPHHRPRAPRKRKPQATFSDKEATSWGLRPSSKSFRLAALRRTRFRTLSRRPCHRRPPPPPALRTPSTGHATSAKLLARLWRMRQHNATTGQTALTARPAQQQRDRAAGLRGRLRRHSTGTPERPRRHPNQPPRLPPPGPVPSRCRRAMRSTTGKGNP